jgi:hypothetical protein
MSKDDIADPVMEALRKGSTVFVFMYDDDDDDV